MSVNALLRELKPVIPYLLKHKNLWANYDEESDTLYLHFKKPNVADDSEMTEENVIVRYEKDEIIGVTILHASEANAYSEQKPKEKKARQAKGAYTTLVKGRVIVKQPKDKSQHKKTSVKK